jgi:transcriptional regulator with XRE-family HTH domain
MGSYAEQLRLQGRRPIQPDEVPHLERLGARLRELRNAAGLTLEELAHLSHLSLFQVWAIENACRRTRRSTLARIAGAIVSVDPAHTDAEKLTDQLAAAAGPGLAPESAYAELIAKRRRRRVRRGRYSLPQPGGCPTCGAAPSAAAGA